MTAQPVFYVFGAGLGHLTRIQKFLQANSINQATIISNTQYAFPKSFPKHFFKQEKLDLHFVDIPDNVHQQKDNLQAWIFDFIQDNKVSDFYVDTFPVGIKGELNALSRTFSTIHTKNQPKLKLYYLGRNLKWENYIPLIETANHFECSFFTEILNDQQRQFLENHSNNTKNYSLPILSFDKFTEHTGLANEFCLVVHAGSHEEIEVLCHFAHSRMRLSGRDLPLYLNTPASSSSTYSEYPMVDKVFHEYPATQLMSKAKIVVSAAGFNTLHDMRTLYVNVFESRSKREMPEHWIFPFERRWDDQFLRAKKYEQWQKNYWLKDCAEDLFF